MDQDFPNSDISEFTNVQLQFTQNKKIKQAYQCFLRGKMYSTLSWNSIFLDGVLILHQITLQCQL